MKKLIIPSLACAVTLVISSCSDNTSSDSVKDIVTAIENEKANKLAAYLQAKPKADDYLDGVSQLILIYTELEEPEKALPLLQEKYALLTEKNKNEEPNLNELLPGTVQPMVKAMASTGDREGAKNLVEKVKADLSALPMSAQINQFLDQLLSQINAPSKGDVLEIKFTDLNGEKVDLAAMKGKVVLLDFWATWCGPCVAELPNVLEAYKKHHENGFEIIGISLDQDEAALKGFIEEHNMPWPQYFDGKGWKNDIAQQYSVKSIPATYLIGKDGKVIASNLRGAQLEEEVALQLKAQ